MSVTTEPTAPSIQLRNVGVARSDRWILRDINWEVPAGSCAAILGPNGSGKSTLTKVIAGHLWPTTGDVRVLGEHFGEVDLHALRRGLRLVSSTSPVELDPELTAHEVALTGFFGTLGLYDEVLAHMYDEAADMLDCVGLHPVAKPSLFDAFQRREDALACSPAHWSFARSS